MKGRLKSRKFQSVDLENEFEGVCVLPNGKLVFTKSESLCIYDENFNFIENITTINNSNIQPDSVATNNIDRIYISDINGPRILMTDLEFKFMSEHYDKDNIYECFFNIVFHNEFLYACDFGDRFIVKFDSDLKINTKYNMEIEPVQIAIINNLACIIPYRDNNFFYFYDLVDFKIKCKYPLYIKYFTIVHDNNFFALNINEAKIDCYDQNGTLLDSISIDYFKDDKLELSSYPFLACNKNNKLFIHLYKNKLFVI